MSILGRVRPARAAIGPVLVLAAGVAAGSDYRVAPGGDDSGPGTAERPWRTVGRANRASFRPGDRLLFDRGATYAGPLVIDAADGGDPARPVVVGSAATGPGRATIDGADGSGVIVRRARGIEVRDLVVSGSGRKNGNRQGRGVEVERSDHVAILGVEARGFQHAGVRVGSSRDVRVERVEAVDNGFAGIFVEGGSRVRVADCRAIGNAGDPTITTNHSGSGILLYDATDSVVERSEAAENGADQPIGPPNGPVGIWAARCARVAIRDCISHHNTSTSGDGGGFDLDGGTTDSTIERCYSYRNRHVGFLVWEYGSNTGIKRVAIRHCLSVEDGGGGFRLGTSGPGGVERVAIERNLVVSPRDPAVRFDRGSEVRDVRLAGNLFLVGPGVATAVDDSPAARFEGNGYWTLSDGRPRFGRHDRLDAWAAATGQETAAGRLVGLAADPRLAGPLLPPPAARVGRFADDLAPYRLRAGSPALDRGPATPADRDLFGRPARVGPAPDLGPIEGAGPS